MTNACNQMTILAGDITLQYRKQVLEKLRANDSALKEVNLNNICGISEQLFCDIFNALKNNDKCVKFSACNTDVRLIRNPFDIHFCSFVMMDQFICNVAFFIPHDQNCPSKFDTIFFS